MVIIDIPLHFLLIIVIAFAIVLFCLYLYLVYIQLKETRKQNKKTKYIKRKQRDWHEYLINDNDFSVTLVPKQEFEIQGVEEIFLAYIRNLTDETVQKKIKRFSNEYLTKHYAELLKSKSISDRILALYRIADFHMDYLIEDCEKLEGYRISQEERFQLLRIYALFKPKTFLKKLVAEENLSDYEFKKLLLTNDDWFVQELIEHLHKLTLDQQYSLIDTIGLKRNLDFLPFLENLLNHEDVEMRIRSLKAIYEIGIVKDINTYFSFVNSPHWEERLMVGKLFEYIPLSRTRPYLEQMIQDPSWWVRYQAANTIMNRKGGKEILQNFISTATDRYAVDIAKELLNR
ncbi:MULTISPECIES: HEAT repeat domain-containing protein [Bacillus]|uniref:HEAT repeat domain-containing protein n=1 Tax=Bacillus TaxID=1386 RepID=UPI0002DBFB0A|nr:MULTISPECIES: hypothetical protein [Bacillus]